MKPGSDNNSALVNSTVISDYLMHDAPWSGSHGADGDYLGMGLFYYSIVYMLKARVAVCLGSGGGFVPRLMRQAQRDLGIADASRTVLVDGNNPGAGWGSPAWLNTTSFFRQQFSDIELLIDLTSNAQHFFEENKLSIDYLHIDADHSFSGCLSDFHNYWRFLHEGSVVTLHDTNFRNAGVKHVVEYIRTLGDCEVIDFPEIGAGTALVRIGNKPVAPRCRSLITVESNQINLTRRADAPPLSPPQTEWKYLESEAFSMRYVIAGNFVDTCRSVVEIGGAKTPIDQFLKAAHDKVIVIDPFIRESRTMVLNGEKCSVEHVRARFQDVHWDIPQDADYGLVMLGLEIQGLDESEYQSLFKIVNRAKLTVIEFPLSWAPSREQFEKITSNTKTRIRLKLSLDLKDNDFGDLTNSWPPRCDRVMYVLEPRQGRGK